MTPEPLSAEELDELRRDDEALKWSEDGTIERIVPIPKFGLERREPMDLEVQRRRLLATLSARDTENRRLREALRRIAHSAESDLTVYAKFAEGVARAALEPSDDKEGK